MAIPVFSNKPKVCQKQLSLEETLTLAKFNVLTESSLETSTVAANANACGDPNLGTTFVKNVVHQVIRCGGENIDINWFRDLFPQATPTMVNTKRWFNHYVCDTNMNIYAAANVTGTGPGVAATFQVLKQFHGGSGHYSLPAVGYSLWDKDRMIEYRVTAVDTTTNYAHKVSITPTDESITVSIKANVGYLITPSRRVGGNNCKQIENAMSSIGYSQEVRPLRVRKDWEIAIDLLRGYLDKIQYAVIYDMQGNPMDSWDVYEAQQARLAVQMSLNIASFIGTPTTNTALISDTNQALIDQFYTGFYGLLPSIKYGNGVVYPFRSSVGFDFEADGEPIFLWQDSQKRTSKFLVMHGLGWRFGNNNRTNKLVARTDVGKTVWEAYKRMGALSGDTYEQSVAKLGISMYSYEGFELDFKRIGAFSDVRFSGSDYYSNLGIMMPKEGAKENGRPINPMEFYQIGNNGWTGNYFESYVDNRFQTEACETIQGYSAESLAFALHCPDLWVLLEPAIDA